MSNKKNKVVVGLSGGVDSAVVAYLLKKDGYEVIGISMSIYKGEPISSSVKGCYGCEKTEEKKKIKQIADILDIPVFFFDCSDEYKRKVLDYFKKEYLAGRTPNPCIQCNILMKFGLLPELARKEGIDFDFFATGHYARVMKANNGLYYLRRAIDTFKDQTYFLYRLSQEQLARVLFPLGDRTKEDVRKIANEVFADLNLASQAESQDFYGGNYNDILCQPEEKGEIVNKQGKVLGYHNGFWNYTIGQRRGLGIAYSMPLYVIAIDADKNRVIVGGETELFKKTVRVKDFFLFPCPEDISDNLTAKIRSTQGLQKVLKIDKLNNDEAEIIFADSIKSVALGQSLVLYQGDCLIGGGTLGG